MSRKFFAVLFICVTLLLNVGEGLKLSFKFEDVEASQKTIDDSAHATGATHLHSGSKTVFINDQTGYKFYSDSGLTCVYSKTTDGGVNWGTAVTVDSQPDCFQIQVWYDKWTPGSASSSIHIVTADTGADDLWYNRLDIGGTDSLLLGSSPALITGGQGGTIDPAENKVAITRGTDGTIYVVSNDGSGSNDSFIQECTVSCNTASNWTETGTNPLDAASDWNLLSPLDNGRILLINRDVSANILRSKIWNNTIWSASWTTIDPIAPESGTYDVSFAATLSSTSASTTYIAYIENNDTLGGDDTIRVGKFANGLWSTTTALAATSSGLTSVAIGLDVATDDVYIAFSGQPTAGTGNPARVYWRWATSSLQNWSANSLPLDTTAEDIYGVDINIQSDERMYVSWFGNGTDDILGDTIADIYPGVHATTTGTQVTPTYASTSNFYIGGAFVLYDTYKSHAVTGITLTENGTINGATDISNIELYFETDTVAPYNCAGLTYDGGETPFGSPDTNGFSGPDGTSAFSGSTINVSTTTAGCVYVVLDILDTTANNASIDISIANPSTNITVTGSGAFPATPVSITSSTTVLNDQPTLTHFHWRSDNGSEITASSTTSEVEDTALPALQQVTPARVRLQITNEGGSSTPAMQYRLEYALATGACSAETGWVNVGDAGGDWDMYNSANLTDGNNTTDVNTNRGGVSNPAGKTFLTPNSGVKDTSSETGGIVLSTTQFVELEYAIVASTSATEGNTYCFRTTNAGNPIYAYSQYPRVNIAADVFVTASGTQATTQSLPATNFHVGGLFVLTNNTGPHDVTSITITENGTVNGQTGLDDIKLFYDLDISSPYNCTGETYGGGESQFGSTDTDGFSSANGTSTFTPVSAVTITTTATLCVYPIISTTDYAQNGETVDIIITTPSADVVVSGGGSVSPATTRDITGSTTLQGAVLTQTHYHWRSDNGTEASASSSAGGLEDTPITNVSEATPKRLRVQVSNEGTVTSASRAFTLEYGTKISTCSAIGTWINVGDAGGAWDMYNSANLTDGSNTTDVANTLGGVTNPGGKTFLTPNSAVKDASSTVATTTLTTSQFIEMEFSIQQTSGAGFEIPYCFRLSTSQGVALTYTVYPELTTAPKRDFEIQRGTFTMSATTQTLTAGVDYIAPSASTSAFIRITNSHYTGAGNDVGSNTQNADDITVYIANPSNIMTSVNFIRTGSFRETHVSWEIVEFIGEAGSDNEMIVRNQGTVTYGTTNVAATGTSISVTDDNDVVVFITGQMNPDTGSGVYHVGQSTSAWNSGTNEPVFTRGDAQSTAVVVSYAVVEFAGLNWAIQRSEHVYSQAGATQVESISPVNSISRAFIHSQKRIGSGLADIDEFGHEVWLSSVGQVSYFLETGAGTSTGQTSVAWIIENTQTTSGAMEVTPANGTSGTGAEPLTISWAIGKTLSDITNTSIFLSTRSNNTGTNYPRPIAGATIASTTHFELWRSDTGSTLTFRVEIVEWPTAGLAVRQNYYQLYVDNGALIPTDPWPAGGANVGENTPISDSDEPLGEGERARIRVSLQSYNATFPAGTRAFRLQYGLLSTSCSAIASANWITLGNSASTTLWRGYNVAGLADDTLLSGDPPTGGDLVLSVSQVTGVAGTFEESNDTSVNTYAVPEDYNIEYDWVIEQNGAAADSYYCFRMVESSGAVLDGYNNYPQIRTASFTPRTQNWRWYDDEQNETPTLYFENENVAPPDIANSSTIKLRVTVQETKNIAREDVRFKLQYSESTDFDVVYDVVATTTCTATSTWCYANGAGVDNAVITTATLSDAQSCVAGVGDGCGTHNESPEVRTGFRHENNAGTEYEFTIQSASPRVNRVYFFRLYDLNQDLPVSPNTGEQYPSLVTEGASLDFAMAGISSGTIIEGVTIDVDSTPSRISFGEVPLDTLYEAGHRLTVDTNGTQGYQILMMMNGELMTPLGTDIDQITGTNAFPVAWNTGCVAEATSCFGFHTGDDTLQGGSTRFSAIDTYARIGTTTLEEISYSSQPTINETTDIIFRILVRQFQEAGQYESNILYVSVPMF